MDFDTALAELPLIAILRGMPPEQATDAPVQPTDELPSTEDPVTLPPPQPGPPPPPPSPSASPLREERWAQLFEKLDLVIDILEARVEEEGIAPAD